jgi:microcin C transport system substrate-binding protein
VDDAQYMKRIETRDFDITSIWWNVGLNYPGSEQMNYWHSSQADVPGSMNLAGLGHPAVDAVLEKLVNARGLPALESSAHALDRVLLQEQLVIPHWSISNFRVVFWNIFGIPEIRPIYGLGFDTWWIKPEASVLKEKRDH